MKSSSLSSDTVHCMAMAGLVEIFLKADDSNATNFM
jgi:hypothetical protein